MMNTFPEYLSEQERRMAAYYAALSNYRRLAAEFAAEMQSDDQADVTAVEAAGEELARWRAATEGDRMRPIREVAEVTGLGVSTLRKLAAEKKIAAERRFGKLWYVLLEEVQEMVAAGEIVPRQHTQEEKMNEYAGYEINIEFSADSIFGPDPENTEGVNNSASVASYIDGLTTVLAEEFSGAEISVEEGINVRNRVENWSDDVTAAELEDTRVAVDEIIHRHWEAWDWIVRLE